jgi:hypothetical protein
MYFLSFQQGSVARVKTVWGWENNDSSRLAETRRDETRRDKTHLQHLREVVGHVLHDLVLLRDPQVLLAQLSLFDPLQLLVRRLRLGCGAQTHNVQRVARDSVA